MTESLHEMRIKLVIAKQEIIDIIDRVQAHTVDAGSHSVAQKERICKNLKDALDEINHILGGE